MEFFKHQYGVINSASSAEHRLCHQQANKPNEGPSIFSIEGLSNKAAETIRWATENVAGFTWEVAKGLGRFVIAIPEGVWDMAKAAWERDGVPTKDAMLQFLYETGQHYKDLPILGGFITSYVEEVDAARQFEMLRALTTHKNWIDVFSDKSLHKDLFENERISDATLQKFPEGDGRRTVLEFLNSQSVSGRRTLYLQYVDKYIPRSVQESRLDEDAFVSDGIRFRSMQSRGMTADFATAMGGMFGTNGVSGSTEDIARESLEQMYAPEALEQNGKLNERFRQDLQNGLRFDRMKGARGFSMGIPQFADVLPPSTFKGALKLGVLRDKHLKAVSGELDELSHEGNLVHSQVTADLEKLTGENNAVMKKKSETIYGRFMKMSGMWKVAILLGGFFAVKDSPFLKWILTTGFLGAAAMKLAGKDPDKEFSFWTQKGLDKINSFQGNGPADGTSDSVGRTNLIMDYLPGTKKEVLRQQGVGMGLLFEAPLNLLAQSFVMPGDGSQGWHLNPDAGLDKQLRATFKARGYKLDYREFLAKNMPAISEIIGWTFYRAAARDANNAQNIQFVEETLMSLPAGSTPMDFARLKETEPDETQRKRIAKADDIYVRLVAQGCKMCKNNPRDTLGDFMASEVGAKKAGTEVKESPEQQTLTRLERELTNIPDVKRTFGVPFSVRRKGDMVHYGPNGGGIPVAITPFATFSKSNAQEIWAKYQAWKNDANRPADKMDPFA